MAKNSSTGRNVNAPQESLIIAPPSRTKWESVKIFIWNRETKEFLGRTAGSWVQIQLFYVALYAFLAAFFAAMLVVFFQTVDSEAPKWQNDNGLIGSNPGLGFRPKPSKDDEDSVTIQFTNEADGNWKYYSSELKDFLGSYSSTNKSVNCSFNNLPPEDAVCNFDIKLLGSQCTEKNNFGYASGQPCIIIKLNRIYGWIPKTYDDPAQLPEDMPDDLKEYIKTKANKNSNQLNMIWLSCDGESSPDKENIGNLTYTPYRGFPAYYYPYKHIPGYLSPIVAVQFKNPKVGVRIKIECKAWAENIFRNRQRNLGSVSFELFLEKIPEF